MVPSDDHDYKRKTSQDSNRSYLQKGSIGFFCQFLILSLICSLSECFVIVSNVNSHHQISSGKEAIAAFGVGVSRPRRIDPSFVGTLSAKPKPEDIVDVEFEKVYGDGSTGNEANDDDNAEKNMADFEKNLEDQSSSFQSLLDLSLDLDPRWKETRIPFIDSYSLENNQNQERRSIDVKLAFVVELDGIEYGIAVPYDHCAAIAFENDKEDSVTYMSPDDDENEEIMEIMAKHLKKYLGKELSLVRTPRILTITGDLDNYTKNWEQDLLPVEPISTETLLDESDETIEFFRDFMKEQLGEDEYEKTIQEAHSQDFGGDDLMAEIMGDDELLDLFNIPGFGTQKDDKQGIEEICKEVLTTSEKQEKATFESLDEVILGGGKIPVSGDGIHHDGVALKLISFYFTKDAKSYSLVKLLKPYTLVGKRIMAPTQDDVDYESSNNQDQIQFELLLPEEEKILIPKLEQVCQKDLKKAGLSTLFTTSTGEQNKE